MKLLKKINKLLLLAMMATLCLFVVKPVEVEASTNYVGKTQEFRAVWVSHFAGDISAYRDESSYKQSITTILDNMEKMGFNAMIFHIRTHNNALYDTELNPIASWWSNVDFDTFDPLHWIIDECHKRGIEFHAWLNPYRVSSSGVSDLESLAATFPDANPASDVNNLLATDAGVILNPGLPHVRDFIVETCMEVIEKYDVDAIHFDDYFYISGCDDTATREKYNTEGLSLGDFRRKQVDLFMEQLSDAMYEYNIENNKTVQLGISPSGIYRNGSYSAGTTPEYDANGNLTYPQYSNTSGFAHYDNYLYSDTKKWIDEEWIDYILPQTYWAISHTAASYSKLTEWWSWTVEHKKVNLYMGIGIYMSLEDTSSGRYWKGADEVANQLENANLYKNIHGFSFYKYSSMLNSSSLMQGYVQDLENYWVKDIPGAVQQRYTHLPEPDVTNIVLDGTTLSWDGVEDVRGYIVWQTEKNGEVNRVDPDINQLYIYTQDTQVEIEDGYDYFVSTVNLANEISEPISSKADGAIERVINLINEIEIPVTIEQIANINSIKTKYDALSVEEKAQVTNYSVLEFALAQIEALNAIEEDAKAFNETLKTDTTSTYLLPLNYLDYTVSWEYVDSADSSLYNIETGKVLVEYLATTNVELKYTLTKNGTSYSGVHELNIGYVKQSENGLFYRNTPNSMNKLEDASADVSFIGWSGKVLKFNNNVFFIALNNYHELTSNEITKGSWSSCGNVYVNKTSNTITSQASNFSVNTGANYGYIIIGTNGLVKTSVTTVAGTDTITLEPGEVMFAANYLDSQITGSLMKPASNIAVGTKVELITPVWNEEETNETLANQIIEEINSIPTTVLLAHQSLIERVKELYDNSSTAVQQMVTNYSKLESAVATLNSLIQAEEELNNQKSSAITEMKNYISDLSVYSEKGILEINNLLSIVEIEIGNASSVSEVNQIVDSYKLKLDNVLTEAEEDAEIIAEERAKAKAELNIYLEILNQYSSANQNIIESLIDQYESSIDDAMTVTSVLTIKTAGLEELAAVKTLVEEYREAGITEVNELVSNVDYSLYSSANANKIRNKVLSIKTSILASTNQSEINALVEELETLIKETKTKEQELAELQTEKDAAIEVINNSFNIDDYTSANKVIIEGIVEEYVALINAATSSAKIIAYKAEALSKIGSVEIDELSVEKRNAILEAESYIDTLTTSDVGKNQLETLLTNFKEEVENALTSSKVTLLLNNFKTSADEIANDNPINSGNNNNNDGSCRFVNVYLSSFVMISLLAALLIVRKRK